LIFLKEHKEQITVPYTQEPGISVCPFCSWLDFLHTILARNVCPFRTE